MELGQRPTEEQAERYGRMVEAGVPSREAVDMILPDVGEDVRTVCADEWPVDGRVRAARIALNGGRPWVAMSEAERIAYTLRIAYGAMAYAVVSAPPTLKSEAAGLKRVLEFIDRLETLAERIGKMGAPVGADGWTAFLEQVKTDQRLAEALKTPGREKRVQ
jgi:hypothetical protein